MDDMSAPLPRHRRLRDLPLFVKLLVPFLVLILVIGAGGLFLVAHDLSSSARSALNEELLRRSLDARSKIHDRELYLLESVNFAANIRGMATALRRVDTETTEDLLGSVLALKTDIHVAAALRPDGSSVVQFLRRSPRGVVRDLNQTAWVDEGFVRRALRTTNGQKTAGYVAIGDTRYLAIAAPVCAGSERCAPRGTVIVGMDLEYLAAEAGGRSGGGPRHPIVSIFGRHDALLASSGRRFVPTSLPTGDHSGSVRRAETFGEREVETLFTPLEIRGSRVGTLAVGLDSSFAYSSVRSSAMRLAFLFFLAIAGVVAIGVVLTRYLLRQVNPLVETSRELGKGNLAARAPIVGSDELGELAGVLNAMADELQGSHETLERRVEERTEQVQRLLEERTEFFTGISHELRTPIAVILSEARMLTDPAYAEGREPVAEAAQTISASAEQLLARVNDILDLARSESGRLEMRVTDVSLGPVLAEVTPAIEARTTSNGLSFTSEVADVLPDVRADRARLKDAIMNLVDNAVKYTPGGGSVSLTVEPNDGVVAISVSDTGVGIPPDVGARVFEPFFQVAGTRPERGEPTSGLGLALAKRAIEALGGTITYVSLVGAGSTFRLEIPIAGPDDRPATGEVEPQRERRYARTAKTRR